MHNKDLLTLGKKPDHYLQYETSQAMTWCGGCGNYTIQNALKRALALEDINRNEVIFCFDVGCSGNASDKIEGYTIHGLHGRVLPLAAGVKIANHKVHVIAEAGDGATFSEGVNHLVHAVRNDYPILFLHHNNHNYGLTIGQASALTPKGCVMGGCPEGNPVEALNPLSFVLSLKPSFVARVSCTDTDSMTEIFRKALNHKGFAFIDVLQSCPTFNKDTPHEWYIENVKKIEEQLPDYDHQDIWAARKLAEDETLYTGIFYCNPEKQNFLEAEGHLDLQGAPLIDQVKRFDVSRFLVEL